MGNARDEALMKAEERERQTRQIRKEVSAMYREAPSSFNIKFEYQGLQCQWTVRSDSVEDGFKLGIEAVNRLVVLGGNVKADKGNGSDGNGHKTVCEGCHQEGVTKSGISQKNGRAYECLVCPQCNELIPGSFRWRS